MKNASKLVWITNKSTIPYVTIDSNQRLYISSPARELLNVPNGQFRLIAGYDVVNKRIVLAKPDVVRVPDVVPFNFDKRSYSYVKPFVEQAKLAGKLPVRFLYVGKDFGDYPQGTHAFQLEGYKAPDK